MSIEPSPKTAAFAGAWAALGAQLFEPWMERQQPLSLMTSNLSWGAFMLVFLFVPGFFLVLGRQERFDGDWFREPGERARYGVVLKRMLAWILSAGTVCAVWTLVLSIKDSWTS